MVHLVRNGLRYASKADGQPIIKALKTICTAPTVAAAEDALLAFAEPWEHKYPAMIARWRRSWAEFIPFLDFPAEVRKLIYPTNAIESINARFRAATRRRGHVPDED